MRSQIAEFAVLTAVAFAAVFASMAHSAEMSAAPDASLKPSDDVKASVPRSLSDAQIEALIKEIGIRYGGSSEAASRAEAETLLPPPTATLPDAQRQALLREMAHWYDSRMAAAPRPGIKPSQLPPATAASLDPQTQALLRELNHWYDSRIAATPRPEVKPGTPSRRAWRRHWRHYASHADADRGEAARLMREELQQRGVAIETAAASGEPK